MQTEKQEKEWCTELKTTDETQPPLAWICNKKVKSAKKK